MCSLLSKDFTDIDGCQDVLLFRRKCLIVRSHAAVMPIFSSDSQKDLTIEHSKEIFWQIGIQIDGATWLQHAWWYDPAQCWKTYLNRCYSSTWNGERWVTMASWMPQGPFAMPVILIIFIVDIFQALKKNFESSEVIEKSSLVPIRCGLFIDSVVRSLKTHRRTSTTTSGAFRSRTPVTFCDRLWPCHLL